MASELSEIRSFLGDVSPFDRLNADRIAAISRRVTVRYFRAGDTILEAGSHNDQLFIVRSGSVESVPERIPAHRYPEGQIGVEATVLDQALGRGVSRTEQGGQDQEGGCGANG